MQNRRILVITDYLPPQTHGIAIRCHAYVKHMRSLGHEVVVFCTAYEPNKDSKTCVAGHGHMVKRRSSSLLRTLDRRHAARMAGPDPLPVLGFFRIGAGKASM